MSLAINSQSIAEGRIQGVNLRPLLGAYELIFALSLTIQADKTPPRRATIMGARVTVDAGGNQREPLGFARPQNPTLIVTHDFSTSMTPALFLRLQPGQLAAIESFRGTGDLTFELLVTGTGTDQYGEETIQDTWCIQVPRSDWIKKLRDAKARDILLLEVPIPFPSRSKKWGEIASRLAGAEQQFRSGDYHACVASCRTVIEELGYQRFKSKSWPGSLMKRLAEDRDGMTKEEREAALWAAIRHYAHLAHHGGSEGGSSDYSRADAQLILILTSSFVSRFMLGSPMAGGKR